MDIVTLKELQSVAQLWARGGCHLQDFIDPVSRAGYDFKDLKVSYGSGDMITFLLFPKGMAFPIETISVFKS